MSIHIRPSPKEEHRASTMDLHLTLLLAVRFASNLRDLIPGELSYDTSLPGLLWATSSSRPLRVPLKSATGDIILRLP